MAELETPDTLRDDLCTAWHRYIDMLVPLRPALYSYCRRLAGNVWDAEDLAQDTLLRAFGQWRHLPAHSQPTRLPAADGDERLDRHAPTPRDGGPGFRRKPRRHSPRESRSVERRARCRVSTSP